MMATGNPYHAGMQHPAMPHGQPMPGPGPTPGQPMAQGMQMHPGVSGPNGPHVSQSAPMMAGMQSGAGPSVHALSHLAPGQAQHIFQQQQQHHNMQAMSNPALMQQRTAQQQAFLQQQQQRQQMIAQQQQGAMGMGYPNGMNPQLTPQHVAALQAGNMGGQFPIPLPQHMRQQLQQHQQQGTHNPQAAQAAMAHAQAQAQAIQHQNQQQAQAQQQHMQAQAIAMQHAASQSSNPSQSGNQGPSATTQPPQGPMRPPSAMSGPHQGQASPAPQPTPQQGPQQQGPQQQPQQQQQPSTQPQTQNVPQQGPQPPQNPQIQQQARPMPQANARMAAAMMRNPAPAHGLVMLKLMNFIDSLGRFNKERELSSMQYWQNFVAKFFTPEATFLYSVYHKPDQTGKQFEIVYAALPRYFYRLFEWQTQHVQITMDGANEKALGNEGGQPTTLIFSERAKFIHWFEDKSHVVCSGKLTAIFQGDKMNSLSFDMQDHEHYLSRTQLESLFIQPSPNQLNQNQSPRMNKSSAKQRAQQQRLVKQESLEPTLSLSGLPASPVTDWGIPGPMQRFLEVSETMINMQDLMAFYKENSINPNLNPAEAMKSWVAASNPVLAQAGQNQQGQTPQMLQQQALQQGQNMPPGIRTPSGTGQPGAASNHQFMSPAMANLALPNAMNGSPHLMQQNHTPSPAGGHPMAPQHSQQGTNSNPSANTSPNVTNKRRRSTVKVDDEGGADVNGAPTGKVKQSPRVGKRVKAS